MFTQKSLKLGTRYIISAIKTDIDFTIAD